MLIRAAIEKELQSIWKPFTAHGQMLYYDKNTQERCKIIGRDHRGEEHMNHG